MVQSPSTQPANSTSAGNVQTRREALCGASGLTLAALAAVALGGRSVVSAQETSPEASPAADDGLSGKAVIVRLRQFKADQDPAAAHLLIQETFVPLIRAIDGFLSYFGSYDPESGAAVYVSVFADLAGAAESTRLAAEWLQENNYDWFEGEPITYEGVITLAVEGAA